MGLLSLVLAHLVACFWGLMGFDKGRGVGDADCYAGVAVPFRRCSWMQIAVIDGALRKHGCQLQKGGWLLSVVSHSFRLTFQRAIIPRNGLEACTSFFGTPT